MENITLGSIVTVQNKKHNEVVKCKVLKIVVEDTTTFYIVREGNGNIIKAVRSPTSNADLCSVAKQRIGFSDLKLFLGKYVLDEEEPVFDYTWSREAKLDFISKEFGLNEHQLLEDYQEGTQTFLFQYE